MPRKVLLADDSVTAQNMGRRILVDAGYEVVTVNNGSSALKKLAESKPDLIILDVYMPGYGGLEVCQRVRESQETARIPVLLTVGKLEPFKAEESRRVRADAFIVKPFEASELLTALAKLEDKIVPQPATRKGGRSGKSASDEQPAASKEYGDAESGWKARLKIPPPHHPRTDTNIAPDSEALIVKPAKELESSESTRKHLPEVPQTERPESTTPENVELQTSELPISSENATNETSPTGVEAAKTENAPTDTSEPVQTENTNQEGARVVPDSAAALSSSHEEEVAAALASLAPSNADAVVPATMAAAVASQQYSGPRWIAQEVALSDDESSLILEQEMQKAFAAFAAADAACVMSAGEFHADQSEKAVEVAVLSAAGAVPTIADPGESHEQTLSETPEISGSTPQENAHPEENQAAYAAAAGVGSIEKPADAISHAQPPEAPSVEAEGDSQLATAWAAWKQVRDSIPVPELVPQSAEDTAFKEFRQDSPAAAPEVESASEAPEDNSAIASIVDSVLAELKPKLMEEIAKKMKKDKK